MKKIFLSALILMVNFIVFSQDIAFLDKQDIAGGDENRKKEILTTNNDEDWPDCTEPKEVYAIYNEDKKSIVVKWDEEKVDQKLDYEIEYQSSLYREVKKVFTSDKKIEISQDLMKPEVKIKVRRVCLINGEKSYSSWVNLNVNESYFINVDWNCATEKDILDDNSGNGSDVFAVFQSNETCTYIKYNFKSDMNHLHIYFYNKGALIHQEHRDADKHGVSGEENFDIVSDSVVYKFSYNTSASDFCDYTAPKYHDYFGEYAESCSTQCTTSNFCGYIASRLDSTSNDYHALYSHQEGEDCVFFDWDYPGNIENCEGWTYTFDNVEIVLKSGQATVWSKVYSQNIGTDIYELLGSEQFDEVIYNYKYHNGDSAPTSCSYSTNLTFADFNIDVPECNAEEEDDICDFIEGIKATKIGNDVKLQFTTDQNTTQEIFDQIVQDQNIVRIDLDVQGNNNSRVTIPFYDGSPEFLLSKWEAILADFGVSQFLYIDMIVYHEGVEEGKMCDQSTTLEVVVGEVEHNLCDILELLLQSSPHNNFIQFDFNHPDDDEQYNYLDQKLIEELGYQSYEEANDYFTSEVDKLEFTFSYQIEDNSGNVIEAPSLYSNYIVGNLREVVAAFHSDNFDNFYGDSGELEIKIKKNSQVINVCKRYNISYSKVTLPTYSCNDTTYVPPVIDDMDAINNLVVGDVVKMAGFSFIVSYIANPGPVYNGQGLLANPFSNAPILVDFESLQVNSGYDAFEGTLTAVEGSAQEMSDMGFNVEPDTFSIGGEICLKDYEETTVDPVTGLDQWGFDANGNYKNGGKYDDNGFDVNGKYKGTNSSYNDCGCSREGLDTLGHVCDPGCSDSPEVKQFIDSIEQIITTTVTENIDDLIDSLQAKLSTLDCDQYRTIINDKIKKKGFDREFIVGENNKYYEEGMSNEFIKAPKVMVYKSEERDADVMALEKAHVDLYECDKMKVVYNQYLDAINSVGQEEIIKSLKIALSKLSKYEVQEFKKDPQKFADWVKNQIIAIVSDATGSGTAYIDYKHKKINKNSDIFSPSKHREVDYSSDYYALASNDEDIGKFISDNEDPMAERLFLFDQGYRNIKGLSRGYYLEELYKKMKAKGEFIENVPNWGPAHKLPLALINNKGGLEYNIYLDNIVLTPQGAKLDAYFVFTVPDSPTDRPKKLVFEAHDVTFGTNGVQSGELQLKSQIEIRMNNNAKLIIKPTGETKVRWNCDGFENMSLDLAVEVCRNLIIPLDDNLEELPDDERYRIDILVDIASWSDIYIAINQDSTAKPKPFAIAGYTDLKWEVSNLVFDFSDKRSAEVELPSEYNITGDNSDNITDNNNFSENWKGVYFGGLTVHFPSSFSATGEMQTVGVQHLMIDAQGVSGIVTAPGLLDLETGTLGGWKFSIDEFYLTIVRNKLQSAGMNGYLNVPIFKSDMEYTATYGAGNYYDFTVKPHSDMRMGLFVADVVLDNNSNVEVTSDNGDVLAVATLNGEIKPDDIAGNISLKLPSITFTGMKVSNQDPLFESGVWEMSDASVSTKLWGFGINLSQIKMISPNQNEVGLSFHIDLTLVDALKINANGGFDIIGKLNYDQLGRQEWNYDRAKINELGINVEFSAGHIIGSLKTFEGDNKWGKGFQGFVDMEFSKVGNMKALALFGKTDYNATNDEYRYFLVDALAELNKGIPVGPLSIDGFAGGVSYHMSKNMTGADMFKPIPESIPPLGTSLSGVQYTPNDSLGLGLKAGAMFSMANNKEIVNGTVNFGILFNDVNNSGRGGINSISFDGAAKMMASLDFVPMPPLADQSAKPEMNATLSGYVHFDYNFNNNEFHGAIKAFMDSYGHFLTGAGTNYKMVDTEIYFGSDTWYIYIGTPSDRCGVNVQLPVIGTAKLTAYLDVGKKVPNMPPLPRNVRAIASKVKPNQTFRNSGAGFVFGASLDIAAALDVGIGQANLKAGLGFDLMMRHFENAHCAGTSDYGENIGIGGWYAMGQMWAYLEGNLTIKGINVMKAGIAGVLQAQLPNPFFAQATLGVKVKIWRFKFHKNMKVELGDYCTIVSDNSNSLGMEVISFIDPADGSLEMPVDISPNVYLNIPLDKTVEIPGLNGQKVRYKALLKEVVLTSKRYGEYKEGVDYEIKYENDSSLIVVDPYYMLYAHDTLILSVSVDVFKNNSSTPDATETKTVTFVVGKGYNYIPKSNIAFSYPVDGMYNFYRDEWNEHKGYIQLEEGQPELFYTIPDDMDQKMRLTSGDGEVHVFDYNYMGFENIIEFPMNMEWLQPGMKYKLEIVRLPKGSYEEYYVKETNTGNSGSDNTSMTGATGTPLYQPPGEGVVNKEENKSRPRTLVSLYFRVSNSDSFIEKINNVVSSGTNQYTKKTGGLNNYSYTVLYKKINNSELFDLFEISGNDNNDPLITINSNSPLLTNWYKDYRISFYSRNYPIDMAGGDSTVVIGSKMPSRKKPRDAGYFVKTGDENKLVINNHIYNSSSNFSTSKQQGIVFDLAAIVANDINYLQGELSTYVNNSSGGNGGAQLVDGGNTGNKAQNRNDNKVGFRNVGDDTDGGGDDDDDDDDDGGNGNTYFIPPILNGIYKLPFNDYSSGDSFKIELFYNLPGKNITTSSKKIEFKK